MGQFPRDMFFITYHYFRRVMCSTKYNIAQKDSAFDGLIEDCFRCDLTDSDKKIFVAVAEEWSRRRGWEEIRCDRGSEEVDVT